MDEQEKKKTDPSFGQQMAVFLPAALTACGAEALIHAPLPLGIATVVMAYLAAKKSPIIYDSIRQHVPLPEIRGIAKDRKPGEWTPLERLMGEHLKEGAEARRMGIGNAHDAKQIGPSTQQDPRQEVPSLPATKQEISFEVDGEDDMPVLRTSGGMFLFSDVLSKFDPTLDRIFLARTADGVNLYCHAKDLCHVALAGSTGGGKSSIMRMLMLQLCKTGVRVLLLNPHYTGYDLENDEDWTPFESYLARSPMECRDYKVIEHYLKSAAKDLIPKRLEKRAHSQLVGKPYFIVIDELPSIVREVPTAPDYIRVILEEGRKVGVFLISAAQDFLVRSVSPKGGGGSVRECYRTAYYVGGDPTTARVLLDMPAANIQEDELGKGVVMLRGTASQKASQVLVPYVDNISLYRILGPSTYKASTNEAPELGSYPAATAPKEATLPREVDTQEMEARLRNLTIEQILALLPDVDPDDSRYGGNAPDPHREQQSQQLYVPKWDTVPMNQQAVQPRSQMPVQVLQQQETAIQQPAHRYTAALSPDLQLVYKAYQPGLSHRDIAKLVGISHPTVGKILQRLRDKGFIGDNGQKIKTV